MQPEITKALVEHGLMAQGTVVSIKTMVRLQSSISPVEKIKHYVVVSVAKDGDDWNIMGVLKDKPIVGKPDLKIIPASSIIEVDGVPPIRLVVSYDITIPGIHQGSTIKLGRKPKIRPLE